MKYADKVTMRYEGDKDKPETLRCVFTWRGHEWEMPYRNMRMLAQLYDAPGPVTEYVLNWAKMLQDPD